MTLESQFEKSRLKKFPVQARNFKKKKSHQGRDCSGYFLILETGLRSREVSKFLEVDVAAVEEAEMKPSSLSFCPLLVSSGTSGWRISALLSSAGKKFKQGTAND